MGCIHVKPFYLRRLLRIWPLYFCFLSFGILLGLIVPSYRIEPGRIWAMLLLAGNWYVASTSCGANPIAPLWSISVEEQFYLVWPWIAKHSKRWLGWISVSLLPLSWLTLFVLSRQTHPNRAIWVNSLVQFQFFGVGSLLATSLRGRVPRLKPFSRIILILGGMLLWLIVAGELRIKDDNLQLHFSTLVIGYTLVALGCVCFFIGFLGAYIPYSRPLVYLGKISYGLYVFHMIAVDWAWRLLGAKTHLSAINIASLSRIAIRYVSIEFFAISITVCIAGLSYRFLEAPFLNLKKRFTIVKSRAH